MVSICPEAIDREKWLRYRMHTLQLVLFIHSVKVNMTTYLSLALKSFMSRKFNLVTSELQRCLCNSRARSYRLNSLLNNVDDSPFFVEYY